MFQTSLIIRSTQIRKCLRRMRISSNYRSCLIIPRVVCHWAVDRDAISRLLLPWSKTGTTWSNRISKLTLPLKNNPNNRRKILTLKRKWIKRKEGRIFRLKRTTWKRTKVRWSRCNLTRRRRRSSRCIRIFGRKIPLKRRSVKVGLSGGQAPLLTKVINLIMMAPRKNRMERDQDFRGTHRKVGDLIIKDSVLNRGDAHLGQKYRLRGMSTKNNGSSTITFCQKWTILWISFKVTATLVQNSKKSLMILVYDWIIILNIKRLIYFH